MTREEFEARASAEGYGTPKEVSFAPNSTSEMHTHDQQSYVFVVAGEFILRTTKGGPSYASGQTCVLAANIEHAEQAGPNGAKILVARK